MCLPTGRRAVPNREAGFSLHSVRQCPSQLSSKQKSLLEKPGHREQAAIITNPRYAAATPRSISLTLSCKIKAETKKSEAQNF